MLAKVVKREAAEKLTSLRVFEIGASHAPQKEMHGFVFPSAANLNNSGKVEAFSPESEVSAPISFDFDKEKMVEDILQQARDEAAQIIKKAEAYQADLEQAAREKGLQEARLIIEAEIAERINAEVSPLRENLAAAIAQISSLESEITAKIENELVEFALEIAKKVVGREVTIDREVALTLVKISLAKLHNRTFAKVYLNPQDLAFVETHRERLNYQGSIELVEDRSISPGGCLIHTETGEIDARIESQFDEIAHGLLGKG